MIVDGVPCVARKEMSARDEPFVAVDDYDTSIEVEVQEYALFIWE